MVRRIVVSMMGAFLAAATICAQATDQPKVARPATDARLKSLAESEAYEYSLLIREKKADGFEEIAAPRLISRIGSESFAGLPHGDGKNVNSSLPSRVYCKAKVENVKDGVAALRITVGQSFNISQTADDIDWTESNRSVRRHVKLGDRVSVKLPASTSPNSETYDFTVKVKRYVPKLSANQPRNAR